MANVSDGAYGLTLLCPIKNGSLNGEDFSSLTRDYLRNLALNENSPMAKVPNTFLCRFYLLNDVFYQGYPFKEDHLKSQYLVFSSNFHTGENQEKGLENYLSGFWLNAQEFIRELWSHCVGFEKVVSDVTFQKYIKACQVETTFMFNGSSGKPLDEQLKALYLKQQFSEFVVKHQNKTPAQLKAGFKSFINENKINDLNAPTWRAGQSQINNIVVENETQDDIQKRA